MNNVTLTGRLAKNPELHVSNSTGKSYCYFTLCVKRTFKTNEGKFESDFIDCVAFTSVAERICKYSGKGLLLGVTGHIQTRSYEQNGEKKYVQEVVCDVPEFIEWKKDSGNNQCDPDENLNMDENTK